MVHLKSVHACARVLAKMHVRSQQYIGSFGSVGMSKETGELYPGASPQPQITSTGYSRATPATGTQPAAEDTEHRAMGDGSQIRARHGHFDAKENIASTHSPAYSHGKVCSVAAVVVALL